MYQYCEESWCSVIIRLSLVLMTVEFGDWSFKNLSESDLTSCKYKVNHLFKHQSPTAAVFRTSLALKISVYEQLNYNSQPGFKPMPTNLNVTRCSEMTCDELVTSALDMGCILVSELTTPPLASSHSFNSTWTCREKSNHNVWSWRWLLLLTFPLTLRLLFLHVHIVQIGELQPVNVSEITQLLCCLLESWCSFFSYVDWSANWPTDQLTCWWTACLPLKW